MAMPVPLWLFPAGGDTTAVRLLGPAVDARFPGELPAVPATAVLLTGAQRQPLEGVLAPSLAEAIRTAAAGQGAVLHLSAQLPAAWQQLPWEGLRLDGETLASTLVAVRYAEPALEPPARRPLSPRCLASLVPRTELSDVAVPERLSTLERVYWRPESARRALEAEDLSAFGVLLLLAHGREAEGTPLQLPDGTPWELPPSGGAPALVVLLACGDTEQQLLAYARTLYQRGAETVLAAQGRLEAGQALAFGERLLAGLDAGESVAGTLLAARRTPGAAHGSGRLCLIGCSDPAGVSSAYADWPRAALIERIRAGLANSNAAGVASELAALAERLTLEAAAERASAGAGAAPASERLSRRLEPLTPAAAAQLPEALAAAAEHVPPVTRHWLEALAAYAFEQSDHQRMATLLARNPPLEGAALQPAPTSELQLAKAAYRQGRYPAALEQVGQALEQLRLEKAAPCTPELLSAHGLLLNISLDLALPGRAEALSEAIQVCLASLPEPHYSEERFKRLDAWARLALRAGRWMRAQSFLAQKCQLAAQRGDEQGREALWQLYTAAWSGEGTDEAVPLTATLAPFRDPDASARWGAERGNSWWDYAARALALWAWRRADESVATLLRGHAPILRERLTTVSDPGPLGQALAFLHLAAPTAPGLSELWAELAVPRLAEAHYALELTALHWLLGEVSAAHTHWERFRAMRRNALTSWEQAGATAPLPACSPEALQAERAQREHAEAKLLETVPDAGTDPARALVAAGMLPL